MRNAVETYLGIDFGTSGARAIAITPDGYIAAQVHQTYASAASLAVVWEQTLWSLLTALPLAIRQCCQAIAIDGTSGTVMLCDRTGQPVTQPLLYNDDSARAALTDLAAIASGPAVSSTSSLVKALWWAQTLDPAVLEAAQFLLHQADWLGGLLHGQLGVSDYHNALKLGYDVQAMAYPDWLLALPVADWLPRVHPPGSAIAPITAKVANHLGLPSTCIVKAGTTDSIAAFLASGASLPGEAVTSLGSTLVLKLLSRTPVVDAASGVYSHRLGDLWLAGGASNTGGAVLRTFFADDDLAALSSKLQPEQPTQLNYYPLLRPGERFPISDPDYPPRLLPRPNDPVRFLQGLLEGMAQIETMGYARLMTLGSSPLKCVYTAGGGAKNEAWQRIRAQRLKVPVSASPQTESAYGAARLAQGLMTAQAALKV
ncbi:MAG: FGGY-family carbohydrate kinase [Cyanobacteria bacterium P01_D01_bin.14]